MIVYIYNIGVDLYNGFNGLRHRINWTYFTILDGLAHPLYSINLFNRRGSNNIIYNDYNHIIFHGKYLYTDISITELSVFMDISYCISNL